MPVPTPTASIDALGAPRAHHRNLVVLRAGAQSLHPAWFAPEREFHLVVDCYAEDPDRYLGTCDELFRGLGPTGAEAQFRLFTDNPRFLDDFDCIWIPDDDIDASVETVNELFRMHRRTGYGLAQPSLSRDSHFTHSITVQHDGFSARRTNFVESMVPIWTSAALRACLPTLEESRSSWGLDCIWPAVLERAGVELGIYDALAVRHTRPVGSRGNQGFNDWEAQREAELMVTRWGGSRDFVPTVLAAFDESGEQLMPHVLFQRLAEGFPHDAAHAQPDRARAHDAYGRVMRRALTRRASSQLRIRQVTADAERRGRRQGRRNLVVLRAGEGSLHPAWYTDDRDFDLVVDAHGPDPDVYAGTCDELHRGLGETGSLAQHTLFSENPRYLTDYDAIWFPDDDIETDTATINALFALHHQLGYDLAQPALTPDSYYSHSMLLQHSGFSVREVNFVETMVPLFTREALAVCLPTLAESRSAHGLEVVWQSLLRPLGGRSAVYDCLPVRHGRPLQAQRSGISQAGTLESAAAEQLRLVRKYNAPDPSLHLVERGWNADFSAVPAADLDRAVAAAFPRPTVQEPHSWDFHAVRFGRVPSAPVHAALV